MLFPHTHAPGSQLPTRQVVSTITFIPIQRFPRLAPYRSLYLSYL